MIMRNSNTDLAHFCIEKLDVSYIMTTNDKKLAQMMLSPPDEKTT